ncbi:hypothetical protein DXG03_004925 [Asterophora parasitica]|uniref:NAD(P)-binding protein n=1 Tax=Asterophora parasitica TaxID=117018 RepID=A0A9P7GE27_9AGAR|nr:hypothetical protein DXG03_004925 [Asterophora parasitica]
MGVLFSLYTETYPPASKFSVDDIPDLTGRVVIVTGANTDSRTRREQALLAHNAKVYIAARNQEKAEAAIKDLHEQTGNTAIFLKIDLADLPSIKAGAEEFLKKETDLHVLFNNGGVMLPPVEQVTAQGYDLQFGTNFLGHFYLTKLLLPALRAGAKSSADGKARVVNTSSSGHTAGSLDFNTFKDTPKRKKTASFSLYAQSKFANVVFSNELARRYADEGIVSTALNPGNLESELGRHVNPIVMKIVDFEERCFQSWVAYYPVPLGALTQLYAGTSAEGVDFSGKRIKIAGPLTQFIQYLIPWARIGTAIPATDDPELGKQLWTWAEEQVANV